MQLTKMSAAISRDQCKPYCWSQGLTIEDLLERPPFCRLCHIPLDDIVSEQAQTSADP